MPKQNNIPKLRFPEFDDSWIKTKLIDEAEVYDGTHQTPKYVKEGVKFVSVEDISNLEGTSKFITPKAFEKDFKTKPKSGDILMTRITAGIIGATSIVQNNDPLGYYVSLALIRKKNKLDVKFLDQTINSILFKKELHKRIIHVAFPKKINLGDIGQCKFSIPSLPEQQKIAAFLTAVDKKIEQLQQKKELLEQYKKGVMQKLFNQEIRFKPAPLEVADIERSRNAETGLPDENDPSTSSGSKYPDWEKKILGELVEFMNGKAHEKDISENGNFIVVNSKFISSEGKVMKYSDQQICPLKQGDVVMVMSDVPNGKALAKCFYIDNDNLYTLNQRICALQYKSSNSKFLFYVLNRNKYYLKFDSGVGQTNLKKSEVLNCPINLPKSREEQNKIAQFLTNIDINLVSIISQINQAQTFKKGLLQQLFI
jgi:type I restriction enzyme S subunit